MGALNKLKKIISRTHEGAPAKTISPEQELRRSVMACLLWEDSFYEEGTSIAERIATLTDKVDSYIVSALAVEARSKMKLRHVPLLLARNLARKKYPVARLLNEIIQRPDELTEFLAIYWKDKKEPLSAQVKKGLAAAFGKFDSYQLAKYNRDGAVKLRDVLFLSHAKPKDQAQEELWKKLIDGTLESPDTWEVSLSAGVNKKQTWERLLSENKLGALALLRNLRNMQNVGVSGTLVKDALSKMKVERVLPFRFISAARFAPDLEPELEMTMMRCLSSHEKLPGKTILLIDVSGSMDSRISGKSDMTRIDAACGLGILTREICSEISVYTFSEQLVVVPPRHGFALRDAINNSQLHSGTYLGKAVRAINSMDYDRIIVITDEQSHDQVPAPSGLGYIINVASYQNGVGYGKWTHIDGWSESVIEYIMEYERLREVS